MTKTKTHTRGRWATVATAAASSRRGSAPGQHRSTPVEEARELRMFSPATFYDVIAAPRGGGPTAESPERIERPAIISFYGFRGGAGRTMALAHAAVALTRRGLGVAAIDLDLESPGLHAVLGLKASPCTGAIYLLRSAFLAGADAQAEIDATEHLQRVHGVDDLWVVPAGDINQKYLATLEELNLPGWHLSSGRHPLYLATEAIRKAVPKLDVVLVDCRTGFHPVSATSVFHASDAVVLVSSLSPQAWEGVDVFLQALAVARSRRQGAPQLMLLRSMVPPGEVGDQLAARFSAQFREAHDRILGVPSEKDAALLENPVRASWELDPIRYDADIAARGTLELKRESAFDKYRLLAESLATAVGADLDTLAESRSANLDRRKVLSELDIPKSAAFAEEIPQDSIADLFVKSSRHARIVDPHSTLVVGAKGAGKSLFWRWLIHQPVDSRRFIAGHAPRRSSRGEGGPLTLSPDALKELERTAQMIKNGTHKAFWALYALARIAREEPEVRALVTAMPSDCRAAFRTLLSVDSAAELQDVLRDILKMSNAGTMAETALARADELLEGKNRPRLTLVYDGLDDGFDVGEDAEAMQQRYVVALLQLLGDVRGRHAWVSLKVFLREDVWESATLQNRSHLEAGRVDLRWETHDLWQMALRLVRTSKTYGSAVVSPSSDSTSADELERALEPLWGRLIGGKQTARTANYVKNRMADGLGRFFPRTLVQMLETAVEHEKKNRDAEAGRIIRLRSLQLGIEAASKARVKDVETEYTVLAPYLNLFSREQPTGSPIEFRDRLQRKYAASMRAKKSAKRKSGVEAGALHAGPGGWMKVVDFLKTVGVLGPRDGRDDKLQVALLYRPGLGIPSYGG